ncbi:MAG: DUF3892 domain-containing protein [Ignavibacteriaceae bacterium]
MAKRIVNHTIKNNEGVILFLLNPTEQWSPRAVELVISDIENGIHTYVVDSINIPETSIHVVNGPKGKYLRTDPDLTKINNLDFVGTLSLLPPLYLGNYPNNSDSDWSDNLQGVTHSLDHWFFTQKTRIIKFHVSTDLDTNTNNAIRIAHMPQELKDLGCNHFGDPDYIVIQGTGYLFVPVEEEDGNHECNNEPQIAVFRDDTTIDYIGACR